MSHFRGPVRLENKDGELIAFISSSMPDNLQHKLLDCLKAVLPSTNALTHTDSVSHGSNYSYEAFYFSLYNRYTTQVSPPSLIKCVITFIISYRVTMHPLVQIQEHLLVKMAEEQIMRNSCHIDQLTAAIMRSYITISKMSSKMFSHGLMKW